MLLLAGKMLSHFCLMMLAFCYVRPGPTVPLGIGVILQGRWGSMGLRQLYFGVLGPMIQQSNDHLYHLSGVNLCSLKGV